MSCTVLTDIAAIVVVEERETGYVLAKESVWIGNTSDCKRFVDDDSHL